MFRVVRQVVPAPPLQPYQSIATQALSSFATPAALFKSSHDVAPEDTAQPPNVEDSDNDIGLSLGNFANLKFRIVGFILYSLAYTIMIEFVLIGMIGWIY